MVLTEAEKRLLAKFRRVVKYAQEKKSQSSLEVLVYPGGEQCKFQISLNEKVHLPKLAPLME